MLGGCCAGGVIATCAVAVGCALFSPPSHVFDVAEQPRLLDAALNRQSWSGQRRPAIVATTSGLGYESMGVWWQRPERLFVQRHPPDAYSTLLGWPNHAFSVRAVEVGDRLFADPHGASGAIDRGARDAAAAWSVRCEWSGFWFNSVLFASVCAGGWACVRRPARSGGRGRRVVLIVCLAGWIVLLVAWSAGIAHHTVSALPHQSLHVTEPAAWSHLWPGEVPDANTWNRFGGSRSTSFAYCRWDVCFSRSEASGQRPIDRRTSLSLGWPAVALSGQDAGPWAVQGDPWPDETRQRHLARLTSIPVWWPGFLVDWIVYSIAIGAAWHMGALGVRYARTRRKCCSQCGYAIGSSPVCTECGRSLRNESSSVAGAE